MEVVRNAAPAFSLYKEIVTADHRFDAPTGAPTTYVMAFGQASAGTGVGGGSAGVSVFYLDPADYAVPSRTTYLRLHSSLLANATATTVNFTPGLYPVSACAGGATAVTVTLGTVVSGSTCLFTAPSASTIATPVNSGDFAFPAAGHYAIGCVVSGNAAANSSVAIRARLDVRSV